MWQDMINWLDINEPKTFLTFLNNIVYECEFSTTQPTNSPVCDNILYMYVFFVFWNLSCCQFCQIYSTELKDLRWQVFLLRRNDIINHINLASKLKKKKMPLINKKNVVKCRKLELLALRKTIFWKVFISPGFQNKHFVSRSVALAQYEWT